MRIWKSTIMKYENIKIYRYGNIQIHMQENHVEKHKCEKYKIVCKE